MILVEIMKVEQLIYQPISDCYSPNFYTTRLWYNFASNYIQESNVWIVLNVPVEVFIAHHQDVIVKGRCRLIKFLQFTRMFNHNTYLWIQSITVFVIIHGHIKNILWYSWQRQCLRCVNHKKCQCWTYIFNYLN